MTLRARIDSLRDELSQPDLRLWQAFLSLYQFIDETPRAALGWFADDPDALERVPFNTMVSKWSTRLRTHAAEDRAFDKIFDIAGLGQVLTEAYASGQISNDISLKLVTALLVIEEAYKGLHPAEPASDDTIYLADLRTRLRSGQSLFPHARLRTYTRPRRSAGRRGQPTLNSFLRHLAIVEPPAGLNLNYDCYFPLGKKGRTGFRRIGIIPVINHSGELEWTKEGDNRYKVAIHASSQDAVSSRVEAALAALVGRGVDLVVLPELVGAAWLDRVITNWMAAQPTDVVLPTLVVAGTRLAVDGDGQTRNRAHVFGSNGDLIWVQDKLHAYTFTIEEQQTAACPLGASDLCHRSESIAIDPRNLTIMDLSSSQRLVLLTCEDFAQEDPHTASIRAMEATLVLVPVMAGGRAQEEESWLHRRGMDYLQQPGASSVMANSGALVLTNQGVAASYAQVLGTPRVSRDWVSLLSPGDPTAMAWFVDLGRHL